MPAVPSPARSPVAILRRVSIVLVLAIAFTAAAVPSRAQSADSLSEPLPTTAAQPLSPPRIGGYIQARTSAVQDIGFNAFLNRARASVDGARPARFAYRLLVEFQASAGVRAPATVSLREAVTLEPGAVGRDRGRVQDAVHARVPDPGAAARDGGPRGGR